MKNLQVIGHLGKDAELIQQKGDYFTVMFNIAHTEKYKNTKNEDVEKTDWITCFKRYKNNPEKVLEILKKGLKVYVDGKPNFGIQRGENDNVYVSTSIDVRNMEFMSKNDKK